MYFIPQNSKWYSWAVHTGPLYRYIFTIFMIGAFLVGWRYGMYAWADSVITGERVAVNQLQQQLMQLTQAERVTNELSTVLPKLRKRVKDYVASNTDEWQQKQFDHMITEVQKAGVQINSYNDEREKKKPWGFYRAGQVSLLGKFDQMSRFFLALKQSPYMIQCNRIHINRIDGDTFSASCGLKFMTATFA